MNPSFNLSNYTISFGKLVDKDCIFFEFQYDKILIEQLKNHLKVYWSCTQKLWYALDLPQYRALLLLPPKSIFTASKINALHKNNLNAFYRMQEQLLLKAYSINTQKVYLGEFYQFLKSLKSFPAEDVNNEKLRAYLLYCVRALKLHSSTIHSRINALKFYYETILQRTTVFDDIPRPKKGNTLPKVLSKIQLKTIFDLTHNLKHRMILKMVYGMGLRVSELVNLKLENIDSSRMLVHIQQAKGKKDRYVVLPASILNELRSYFLQYRPKKYLFEGQTGCIYSIRSVQAVFKAAMQRAQIKKQIGIHGLRHSYATHLLEAGTDIVFIQKLLGHAAIKTTMIYTQISYHQLEKIKSPLDHL